MEQIPNVAVRMRTTFVKCNKFWSEKQGYPVGTYSHTSLLDFRKVLLSKLRLLSESYFSPIWNRRAHPIVRRKSRMSCENTFLACTSISLYILKEIHYKFGIFNGSSYFRQVVSNSKRLCRQANRCGR